jgi:hypothetical protein
LQPGGWAITMTLPKTTTWVTIPGIVSTRSPEVIDFKW